MEPALWQDGGPVAQVKVGEQVEVELALSVWEATSVNEEWVVEVNDLALFDQPHLLLNVRRWMIVVTPTPTQSPVLTSTRALTASASVEASPPAHATDTPAPPSPTSSPAPVTLPPATPEATLPTSTPEPSLGQ